MLYLYLYIKLVYNLGGTIPRALLPMNTLSCDA